MMYVFAMCNVFGMNACKMMLSGKCKAPFASLPSPFPHLEQVKHPACMDSRGQSQRRKYWLISEFTCDGLEATVYSPALRKQ